MGLVGGGGAGTIVDGKEWIFENVRLARWEEARVHVVRIAMFGRGGCGGCSGGI